MAGWKPSAYVRGIRKIQEHLHLCEEGERIRLYLANFQTYPNPYLILKVHPRIAAVNAHWLDWPQIKDYQYTPSLDF